MPAKSTITRMMFANTVSSKKQNISRNWFANTVSSKNQNILRNWFTNTVSSKNQNISRNWFANTVSSNISRNWFRLFIENGVDHLVTLCLFTVYALCNFIRQLHIKIVLPENLANLFCQKRNFAYIKQGRILQCFTSFCNYW